MTRTCAKGPGLRAHRAAALLVFLVATVAAAGCHRRPSREPFDAKVVGVSDGDTITVLAGTTRVKVRLGGIDCPERGQAFGTRARQLTSQLAFGRTVTVKPLSRDRYGRTVADVVLPDGRLLNRELVAAGLAWLYTRYSNDAGLATAERAAREARLGVWSEPGPIAPWEFRAAGRDGSPRSDSR